MKWTPHLRRQLGMQPFNKPHASVRGSTGTSVESPLYPDHSGLQDADSCFYDLPLQETCQAEVAWWTFCREAAGAHRGQGYHVGDRVPGTCDGSSGIHILNTTPIRRKNFRRTARSSGIRSNCIISHK